MHIDLLTILGLIGVAIVISVGKIFDGLREWLKGFVHHWNPLPWIGEMMSCTMCSGWWVGFVWGAWNGLGWGAMLTGGLISVLSFAVDELLALLSGVALRIARRVPPARVPAGPPPPPPPPRNDPPALTEAQAEAIADGDEG